MFNHQQRDLSALRRLPGLLAEELPWHSREAKFDLQLPDLNYRWKHVLGFIQAPAGEGQVLDFL